MILYPQLEMRRQPMSIIAIANQKGGVGKTTLAVHIVAARALKDKHVMLIEE
jgi:cellulose biosynthesis protein BcsQ